MHNAFNRIAHLLLFGIGVAAIIWASALGPAFWKYSVLNGIASQIIRGENISSELIQQTIPVADQLARSETCWPKAMHDAAIIRGRLVQISMEGSDPEQFDDSVAAAISMTRKSLSCAPADSFLWFTLFWLENMKYGLQLEAIAYLEKSYELGPNEGWIALKRNTYALISYDALPARLQQRAIEEFAVLVNSGFVAEAAANLTGPGWRIRELLLANLAGTREKYRRWLAVSLRRSGMELKVPGIEMPELRPRHVD